MMKRLLSLTIVLLALTGWTYAQNYHDHAAFHVSELCKESKESYEKHGKGNLGGMFAALMSQQTTYQFNNNGQLSNASDLGITNMQRNAKGYLTSYDHDGYSYQLEYEYIKLKTGVEKGRLVKKTWKKGNATFEYRYGYKESDYFTYNYDTREYYVNGKLDTRQRVERRYNDEDKERHSPYVYFLPATATELTTDNWEEGYICKRTYREASELAPATASTSASVANAETVNLYNSSGAFYYSGTVIDVTLASESKHKVLKDFIKENNTFKNGTLAVTGAGVIVRGTNNYAATTETPSGLTDQIEKRKNEGHAIIDVNITAKGGWVVIFGQNGYWLSGYPQDCFNSLKKANEDRDSIYSASFSDNGQWAIVTNKIFAGDDKTQEFIKKAIDLYGRVYSVYVSEVGKVACCARGIYFENMPKRILEDLKIISFKPRFIKFTDNGLSLITNGDANYRYFM